MRTQTILAFFADPELAKEFVDPGQVSPRIAAETGADGVLIDTFDKSIGKALLDYLSLDQISDFVQQCRKLNLEAWVAGSITEAQMRSLWTTGVDVICVRQAACDPVGERGRFGRVSKERVRGLARTMGRRASL